MADPALLQIYYYLNKIATGNSVIRTTLRELEIGTGLDKMKIKRRLDWLTLEGHIFIISADRSGTIMALGDDHNFNESLYDKHKESIEKYVDEAYKRLLPQEWAEATKAAN